MFFLDSFLLTPTVESQIVFFFSKFKNMDFHPKNMDFHPNTPWCDCIGCLLGFHFFLHFLFTTSVFAEIAEPSKSSILNLEELTRDNSRAYFMDKYGDDGKVGTYSICS